MLVVPGLLWHIGCVGWFGGAGDRTPCSVGVEPCAAPSHPRLFLLFEQFQLQHVAPLGKCLVEESLESLPARRGTHQSDDCVQVL
jgi:hypothetical protein